MTSEAISIITAAPTPTPVTSTSTSTPSSTSTAFPSYSPPLPLPLPLTATATTRIITPATITTTQHSLIPFSAAQDRHLPSPCGSGGTSLSSLISGIRKIGKRTSRRSARSRDNSSSSSSNNNINGENSTAMGNNINNTHTQTHVPSSMGRECHSPCRDPLQAQSFVFAPIDDRRLITTPSTTTTTTAAAATTTTRPTPPIASTSTSTTTITSTTKDEFPSDGHSDGANLVPLDSGSNNSNENNGDKKDNQDFGNDDDSNIKNNKNSNNGNSSGSSGSSNSSSRNITTASITNGSRIDDNGKNSISIGHTENKKSIIIPSKTANSKENNTARTTSVSTSAATTATAKSTLTTGATSIADILTSPTSPHASQFSDLRTNRDSNSPMSHLHSPVRSNTDSLLPNSISNSLTMGSPTPIQRPLDSISRRSSHSADNALPANSKKRAHPESDREDEPPTRRRYAGTEEEEDDHHHHSTTSPNITTTAATTTTAAPTASFSSAPPSEQPQQQQHQQPIHDTSEDANQQKTNVSSIRLHKLANIEDSTNKSLSYPIPDYPTKNYSVDDSNVGRGMSVPPLARLPRRADTTNSTVSNFDVDTTAGAFASGTHMPNVKKHSCPHCGTQFTRHHNLKSHLLTHSEEKPHNCDVCSQRFRRRHDMKRHMKLHTGERPHICPRCGRRFARGDALARHAKGPGGCAGRRESGGSSFGVGESGELISSLPGPAGSEKGRSLSSSSITTNAVQHTARDEGPDQVTVTVSNAMQHERDSSKAGSRDEPSERLIFTEPDLMDEEDEQNTPLRSRRTEESGEDRLNRATGLQHKHATAPDTHHLHPSSAYDQFHRHGRRTPHDPYTYPMAGQATTNADSNGINGHHAPSSRAVMPTTLLPSPVSRANSGNSNDPKSDATVGIGLQSGVPPAVSISDSPESISPKYQGQKQGSLQLDSRRLPGPLQRSVSPQPIYSHSSFVHSPPHLRHSEQVHRPPSPSNSTNASSISQMRAQTEAHAPNSLPIDQNDTDFRGRTPSLKPHYHAALAALPPTQPTQQQHSPRQLPLPTSVSISQGYHHATSAHPDYRSSSHQHSISQQGGSYAHVHRNDQSHRHSASSCGSLGSNYRQNSTILDDTSQAAPSPPSQHITPAYSHSRSQSASRPAHSHPQSTSHSQLTPILASIPPQTSSSLQLHPPTPSVTASPPSILTPGATTAPVLSSAALATASSATPHTPLPTLNPIGNYLHPLPGPRPQRTLSSTSATSNPVGSSLSSGTFSSKYQLPLPHSEGWAYVQTLEDRITALETEVKELRAHLGGGGGSSRSVPAASTSRMEPDNSA